MGATNYGVSGVVKKFVCACRRESGAFQDVTLLLENSKIIAKTITKYSSSLGISRVWYCCSARCSDENSDYRAPKEQGCTIDTNTCYLCTVLYCSA